MKKIVVLLSVCITTPHYHQAAAPEDNSEALKIGWGLCRVEGTNPTQEHIAVTLIADDDEPLPTDDEPNADFFGLYCGDFKSTEALADGFERADGPHGQVTTFKSLDGFLDEQIEKKKKPYLKSMHSAVQLSDAHIKFFIGDTGATAVTAGIERNLKPMLYIVWSSGDSSATLIDNEGNSQSLTPAHTTANAQESKRIRTAHQSPEDEELVLETVSNVYMTRIIGHKQKHDKIAPIGVTHKPETKNIPLNTSHRALVLASETLFSHLPKKEVAQRVHAILSNPDQFTEDPEIDDSYQIGGTNTAAKHAVYDICKGASDRKHLEHITAMVIAFMWPAHST